MNINNYMRQQIKTAHIKLGLLMTKKLQNIIDQGFIIIDGCYLLKSLYHPLNTNLKNDFGDPIGYEAFINHIHMSDYGIFSEHLSYALSYVNEIFKKWNIFSPDLILASIVSKELIALDEESPVIDTGDVIVRFYVKRERHKYCDDNFEKFLLDAIIELESTEDVSEIIYQIESTPPIRYNKNFGGV
ncbi:hypothetical protein FACS189460_5820 [Deltaproteobacteria bacterium]|nr:hypothetical protein FACS189460_5820 [Deltaproteobacteria bacterium]